MSNSEDLATLVFLNLTDIGLTPASANYFKSRVLKERIDKAVFMSVFAEFKRRYLAGRVDYPSSYFGRMLTSAHNEAVTYKIEQESIERHKQAREPSAMGNLLSSTKAEKTVFTWSEAQAMALKATNERLATSTLTGCDKEQAFEYSYNAELSRLKSELTMIL